MKKSRILVLSFGLSLSGLGLAASDVGGCKKENVFSKVIISGSDYSLRDSLVLAVNQNKELSDVESILNQMNNSKGVLKSLEEDEKKFLLHKAAEKGRTDLIIVLHSAGANIHGIKGGEQGKNRGETALHVALASRSAKADETAKFLMALDRENKNLKIKVGHGRKFPIHIAATRGRVEVVRDMLKRDPSLVDVLDQRKSYDQRATPLFLALRGEAGQTDFGENYKELVSLLILAGADVSYTSTNREKILDFSKVKMEPSEIKALVVARESAHDNLILVIREFGRELRVFHKTLQGEELKASRAKLAKESFQRVTSFLKGGAQVNGIYYRNSHMKKPEDKGDFKPYIDAKGGLLHLAAQEDAAEIVKLLSENGWLESLDFDQRKNDKQRAIDKALACGNRMVSFELLRLKYPESCKNDLVIPFYGVQKSQVDILKYCFKFLHKKMVSFLKKERIQGRPFFHLALEALKKIKGKPGEDEAQAVLHLLYNEFYRGDTIQINTIDAHGNTPLHFACELDLDQWVRNLLQDEAVNPVAVNLEGETPLHVAYRNDSLRALARLINHNPKFINEKGKLGKSTWNLAKKDKDKKNPRDFGELTARNLVKSGRPDHGDSNLFHMFYEHELHLEV